MNRTKWAIALAGLAILRLVYSVQSTAYWGLVEKLVSDPSQVSTSPRPKVKIEDRLGMLKRLGLDASAIGPDQLTIQFEDEVHLTNGLPAIQTFLDRHDISIKQVQILGKGPLVMDLKVK